MNQTYFPLNTHELQVFPQFQKRCYSASLLQNERAKEEMKKKDREESNLDKEGATRTSPRIIRPKGFYCILI